MPRTLASHLYIPGLSSSGGRHTPRREPQSCRRRCRLRCFGRSQVQARACDAIRRPADSTFPGGLWADPLRAADVTFFRPTGKAASAICARAAWPRSLSSLATGSRPGRAGSCADLIGRMVGGAFSSAEPVRSRPRDKAHRPRPRVPLLSGESYLSHRTVWVLCGRMRPVKIGQVGCRVFNILLSILHVHWPHTLQGLLPS